MKADTLPTTNNTSKRSGKGTDRANKAVGDRPHGPLPGNGPWIRVDGVWYTKDETGEIVPMKK